SSSQQGFVFLETNYRVCVHRYAFFTSNAEPSNPVHALDNPLKTAVLNLFVSLKHRFVVGSLTRDRALSNGMT
ncbi:hypothetical protein BT96DRAFT_787422, partial [Gymnopus androsaceus JB14]